MIAKAKPLLKAGRHQCTKRRSHSGSVIECSFHASFYTVIVICRKSYLKARMDGQEVSSLKASFQSFGRKGALNTANTQTTTKSSFQVLFYNPNAHCEFHQGPGHTTDRCFSLMRAVQDLIEQGKVVVYSSPSSSNTIFQKPLPPHSVSAPVGSSASVNLIEDAQRQEDLVYLISSASDEVNVISPLVLPVSTRPCLRGPIRVLSQLLHL